MRWLRASTALLLVSSGCSVLFDPSSLEERPGAADAGADGVLGPDAAPGDASPDSGLAPLDCASATICERFDWSGLGQATSAGWETKATAATLGVGDGLDGGALIVTAADSGGGTRTASLSRTVRRPGRWQCELDLYLDVPPSGGEEDVDRVLVLGVDVLRSNTRPAETYEYSFSLGFRRDGVSVFEYISGDGGSGAQSRANAKAGVSAGRWLHVVAGAELVGPRRYMYVSHQGVRAEQDLKFSPVGAGTNAPRLEVGLTFENAKVFGRPLGYRIDNLVCALE